MTESASAVGLGWLLFALLVLLAGAVIANVFAPRFHAWLDRPGISLDHWDGVGSPTSFYDQPTQKAPAPRCWSTGPRGSHAYAADGHLWRCMRCGDEVPR